LPDAEAAEAARIDLAAKLNIHPVLLFRKQKNETEEWLRARTERTALILGTRSAVFAPSVNLGLIIIEEEESFVYKQEQSPHYHARQVAIMRCELENARLILGSRSPSLESFYLAKMDKIQYTPLLRQGPLPEVKIVDTDFRRRRGGGRDFEFISKYALDAISASLTAKEKILVFLDRKGFATTAFCHNCGKVLVCQRCNVNLVYHFTSKMLVCHRCNSKTQTPLICPHCNSGYIKYSGVGVEKVESELARIFPQAEIERLKDGPAQDEALKEADIFVSTSRVMKRSGFSFDLVVGLGIDNTLNRPELRAGERGLALLSGLLSLSRKKLVVETGFTDHPSLAWLAGGDNRSFYENELKERKQLNFPPYRNLISLRLRGKNEEKVRNSSSALFEKLKKEIPEKKAKFISSCASIPSKVRGNFCWQILMSTRDVAGLVRPLKISLKRFPHSGIIITIDVDPLE
jgi:primosomal protein N' (replication factor Y) (superfamily II helicase)